MFYDCVFLPTESVSAFGVGKVNTDRPTDEGKQFSFSIEYSCEDLSGNIAPVVQRWLRVSCPNEEDLCTDSGDLI